MKKEKKQERKVKLTDYQKVKKLLEELELPYEDSTNDGIRPYLFINFDDDGSAIDPC